jgi:hypothetical protein
MPLFLGSILSPFDCLLLDKVGSALVSQSSFKVEPFFKEESIPILASRFGSVAHAYLAFFFDNLSVMARSQILLWILSLLSYLDWKHVPDSLDLILTCLHVNINVPEIQPLRMGINYAFKDCSPPLGISHSVLQLSKFRDGFEI